jgi:Excalibur calcium-binding domain
MRQARSRRRCQAIPAHPMRTSLRPRLPETHLRGRYSQRADRVDRPVEPAGRGRPRQPLQRRGGQCYLAAALQALPLHPRRKTVCRERQVGPLGHCGGTRRDDPCRCHLPDHGFARARLCIACGEITQQPTRSRAPIRPAPAPAPPAGGVSNRNCTAPCAAVQAPIMRGQPGYSRKLDRDGDGIACE